MIGYLGDTWVFDRMVAALATLTLPRMLMIVARTRESHTDKTD